MDHLFDQTNVPILQKIIELIVRPFIRYKERGNNLETLWILTVLNIATSFSRIIFRPTIDPG